MPRDRSIRNIPLPGSSARRPTKTAYEEDEAPDSGKQGLPPHVKLPKKRSHGWVWALLVIILCAVAGLLLSTVFEAAKVTVSAKTETIDQTQTLLAQPGGPTGTLLYQTLTASQSASTSVAANGTQHVSLPATGVVTISNNYSTAPQALAINTRLITSDGKIYRIKTAITVPGAKKAPNGSLTPSSTTVSVYADKPGDTYNTQAPVQMNIAGFKGDPRYAKFIVESQGNLSGGFVGDRPSIAAADMAAAQDTLKKELDQNIRSAANAQVPEGYIAVNGSLGATYSDIAQGQITDNRVVLSQSVTATLAMVRSNDLAVALAKQAVSGYGGEPVAFADASAVQLSLTGASANTGPLSLSVSGNPTLVWQLDTNALQQALLGKKKSDFVSILQQFNSALQCDKDHLCSASIRPFWRATFPSDPKKLTVTLAQ